MLAGMASQAAALIDRVGREVMIRRVTTSGPAFDPVIETTDTAVIAAVFDYDAREINGSTVQASDKQFIIRDTVTLQDRLVDGGREYTVISVERVQPGGDVVMHIAQGRS